MRKLVLLINMTIFLCTMLLVSVSFCATQTLQITKDSLSTATRFSLSFLICGAQVQITRSNDEDTIVKADITYNSKISEPTLATKSSGDTFTAEFRSGLRIIPYSNPNIEEWNIVIGSYDVDTDMTIICKEVTSEFDLGGLPLTNCTVRLRVGNMNVDFDAPTTRQVERFIVSGHGMNLSMSNIGNTDFKLFDLIGFGGTADLDFQGSYDNQQHNANLISVGMIQKIAVPFDAGEQVRILPMPVPISVVPRSEWHTDRWLLFYQQYSTNDYNSQSIKINLGITSVGSFGTVVRD